MSKVELKIRLNQLLLNIFWFMLSFTGGFIIGYILTKRIALGVIMGCVSILGYVIPDCVWRRVL